MEDALVHESNKVDHLEYLKMILMKIMAGLKPKLFECAFFKRHLQYLGHLIQVRVYTHCNAMLVNLALPRDVTETKHHIIELASYYKKFIANFSDIVKPLTHLTRKNTT